MQLSKNKSIIEKPFLMDFGVKRNNTNNQLVVPSIDGYDILNCNEIIYLHAEGNYTNIYCTKNRRYCYSKVLKHVASKIKCEKFLRCHRSYIINTAHLKSISFIKPGYYCMMDNEKVVPVSRSNKSVIKDWINQRV